MIKNGSSNSLKRKKLFKLKISKKFGQKNKNESNKSWVIKENYELNVSNKEDLINELNILKLEIISKKNIIQEKDNKILTLIKHNEKLSQNVEIINNKLKNILNNKLKEQSIKNNNYVFT